VKTGAKKMEGLESNVRVMLMQCQLVDFTLFLSNMLFYDLYYFKLGEVFFEEFG